ncbi:MAG: signal peptidase II [Oscillospiraceae bacterium]|nr:signal peptidase II [Oscillospiraceae bacterium]MBQ5711885.1 signal peptidase II [Oscillospiraceae bacterium]
MTFIVFLIFAIAIVVADQLTKLWVVAQIPLYSQVEALDGLFHLTYVRNFGAAFSSFQGMRWVFVVLFVLLTAALLYEYFKKPMPFNTFERWCLAAIWGGGLGNVIDRVRLGYVVDMIEVEFITFPVFNVADCFITCGCIALMVSLILFNKGFWKEDKK